MNKEILANEWQNYTIIKSIKFESDMDSDYFECHLYLTLCKDEKYPEDEVKIHFSGVSNLKIDEIGGGISQFCRLDVVNIQDKQWDQLNYYVFDYENDTISFNCKDIEIDI